MELFKGNITKEQLLSIPKAERTFFVLLTHLANILYTLRKLTVFCAAGREESNEIVRRAQNAQALLMVRLTAGYLWEGWRLLQANYFGSCLSREYDKVLSNAAKKCLDDIKRYFSQKKCNVKTIRNKFAFHLLQESPGEISELIEQDNTGQYSLYFNKHAGLCFYELPDTLINNAIFSLMKGDATFERLEDLEKEVREIVKKYLYFVNEFVLQFGKKYLIKLDYKKIKLPDPPAMDEVVIPYFVSEPKQKQT